MRSDFDSEYHGARMNAALAEEKYWNERREREITAPHAAAATNPYLPDCDILPPKCAPKVEGMDQPNLGLATTRELLAEITARIELGGGCCLGYSTVRGEDHGCTNLTNPSVLSRGEAIPLTTDPTKVGACTASETPANQRGPGSLTVAGAIDWEAAGDKYADLRHSFVGTCAAHAAAIAKAVAEERERCAKVAENNHLDDGECCYEDPDYHRGRLHECEAVAAAIRGRKP